MSFPFVLPFSAIGTRRAGVRPESLIGVLWGSFRRWFAKRAVLAELSELDQRTLDDLRISPSDFDAIAEGTFRREPPWEHAPMALDLAKLARQTAERPYQYY